MKPNPLKDSAGKQKDKKHLEQFNRAIEFKKCYQELNRYLTTPVIMSGNENNQILLGMPVCIIQSDYDSEVVAFCDKETIRRQIMLSALVLTEDIPNCTTLQPGSVISGSPEIRALRRNVFCFQSVKPSTFKNIPLKYGQQVYIRLYRGGNAGMLFLTSTLRYTEKADESGKYIVELCRKPNKFCRFTLMPCHGQHLKMKIIPQYVMPCDDVAIVQEETGRFLSLWNTKYKSKFCFTTESKIFCTRMEIDSVGTKVRTPWQIHTTMPPK